MTNKVVKKRNQSPCIDCYGNEPWVQNEGLKSYYNMMNNSTNCENSNPCKSCEECYDPYLKKVFIEGCLTGEGTECNPLSIDLDCIPSGGVSSCTLEVADCDNVESTMVITLQDVEYELSAGIIDFKISILVNEQLIFLSEVTYNSETTSIFTAADFISALISNFVANSYYDITQTEDFTITLTNKNCTPLNLAFSVGTFEVTLTPDTLIEDITVTYNDVEVDYINNENDYVWIVQKEIPTIEVTESICTLLQNFEDRVTDLENNNNINIYNSDGILTNDRILQGDAKTLSFLNLRNFTVQADSQDNDTYAIAMGNYAEAAAKALTGIILGGQGKNNGTYISGIGEGQDGENTAGVYISGINTNSEARDIILNPQNGKIQITSLPDDNSAPKVIGQKADGLLCLVDPVDTSVSVNNGLTDDGTNIQLGGTLVEDTTINTANFYLSIIKTNPSIPTPNNFVVTTAIGDAQSSTLYNFTNQLNLGFYTTTDKNYISHNIYTELGIPVTNWGQTIFNQYTGSRDSTSVVDPTGKVTNRIINLAACTGFDSSTGDIAEVKQYVDILAGTRREFFRGSGLNSKIQERINILINATPEGEIDRSAAIYIVDGTYDSYANSNNIPIGDWGIYQENTTPNVLAGQLRLPNLSTYADEAAAITGGLVTGTIYKTATGEVRVKL